MSRSTDTVSWKSRSRENNFVPLARWGVAVGTGLTDCTMGMVNMYRARGYQMATKNSGDRVIRTSKN